MFYIKNPPNSVICEKDDLLMTRTGNTGKLVTGVKGAFHNNFFKIKFDKNLYDKTFIYLFLNKQKTQNKILSLAGTSTIPDLNHGDFYKLKINLPLLPEQQKIASFLSSVDEKIESLKNKKELLEEYKKGVMQKIFSREIRFEGDFGEWEEKKLGEIAEINKGTQLNKDLLTNQGLYPALNGGINPSGYTEKYNRKKNTITISEGGNSCGYVNFTKSKFWCGGHCYSLDDLKCNILFLFQILKYSENNIMSLRVGSGLPNIQKKTNK